MANPFSLIPAIKVRGRTLVPARFVAESLESAVKWDETLKQVIISTEPKLPTNVLFRLQQSECSRRGLQCHQAVHEQIRGHEKHSFRRVQLRHSSQAV